MVFYNAPEKKQYERSLKGLCELITDWLESDLGDVRICPRWELDLLCGASLMILPPLLVAILH
jgi:hypothetical protein